MRYFLNLLKCSSINVFVLGAICLLASFALELTHNYGKKQINEKASGNSEGRNSLFCELTRYRSIQCPSFIPNQQKSLSSFAASDILRKHAFLEVFGEPDVWCFRMCCSVSGVVSVRCMKSASDADTSNVIGAKRQSCVVDVERARMPFRYVSIVLVQVTCPLIPWSVLMILCLLFFSAVVIDARLGSSEVSWNVKLNASGKSLILNLYLS